MIYYITYIRVWCFNLGQYSGQLHTHGGVRNTPIDRLISSMYQWHTYCLKTWIDWHVIHILYYDQTLINSTVLSLKISIAIIKVVPSALALTVEDDNGWLRTPRVTSFPRKSWKCDWKISIWGLMEERKKGRWHTDCHFMQFQPE